MTSAQDQEDLETALSYIEEAAHEMRLVTSKADAYLGSATRLLGRIRIRNEGEKHDEY